MLVMAVPSLSTEDVAGKWVDPYPSSHKKKKHM